jgi:hypothetical protein
MVARGAVGAGSGGGDHEGHGSLWRSREAWVALASFDHQLLRSGGFGGVLLSSGLEIVLRRRTIRFMFIPSMIMFNACYLYYLCISVMIFTMMNTILCCHKIVPNFRGAISWTDVSFFNNYAIRCMYLCDFVYEFMLCMNCAILFFCMRAVETKISSKFFAHAMETPTICHNFWICIKIETAWRLPYFLKLS